MSESTGTVQYEPPVRLTGQRMDAEERELAMAKFLEVFAATGIHSAGCDAAGVARSAIVYWRKHYPKFLVAYKEARAVADDSLRDELERARKDGLLETREEWVGGELVNKVVTHKQDARVLMGAAQARLEEYRPASKVELTGKDGGPIQVVDMSLEDAEAVLRLARGARQLGLVTEPEEGDFVEVGNG